MFASAIGYLWILAPLAFAALVLFIWGCFQTTAELQETTLALGQCGTGLPHWTGASAQRFAFPALRLLPLEQLKVRLLGKKMNHQNF
jgi:hypothetical protein